MTTHSEVILEGKRTDYKLEKFTFKVDRTKNAMVFGKGGYFNSGEMELREEGAFPGQEFWFADTLYASAFFDKGKMLYAFVGSRDVTTISANCD